MPKIDWETIACNTGEESVDWQTYVVWFSPTFRYSRKEIKPPAGFGRELPIKKTNLKHPNHRSRNQEKTDIYIAQGKHHHTCTTVHKWWAELTRTTTFGSYRIRTNNRKESLHNGGSIQGQLRLKWWKRTIYDETCNALCRIAMRWGMFLDSCMSLVRRTVNSSECRNRSHSATAIEATRR